MTVARRERAALWVAYGLLVLVAAWSSWSTRQALDRVEEDVCAVAEVAVAAPLLNVAIYGQQEGVNPEAATVAIETLIAVAETIQDRCGRIFLDEIEVPEIEVPPLSLVPTTQP